MTGKKKIDSNVLSDMEAEKTGMNEDNIDFAFVAYIGKDGQVTLGDSVNVGEKQFNISDISLTDLHRIINELNYLMMLNRVILDTKEVRE